MPARRPNPRPEWALAYVLQDLTKRGRKALREAYEAACEVERAQHDGDDERLPELHQRAAETLAVARKRMHAYHAALEDVA